jgi:hypothetical protein
MDSLDALRHDGAALSAFISKVAEYCTPRDYPSYVGSSKEFFSYISDLAIATKEYISKFIASIDPALPQSDPRDFYTQTQLLSTLRISWFELHSVIKPSFDADTLHTPGALVSALTKRLQKIPGFERARFSVIHTTDLNYYQIDSSTIRDLANSIAVIVSGAKPFPEDLGIVAIPYSQSSSIFLNTALAHEMGHFSFQKRNEKQRLVNIINPILQANPSAAAIGSDIWWCRDRVLAWCQEIYCDLFALSLIGPSFSFGYIELFALTRDPALALTSKVMGKKSPHLSFAQSHPATALRLREHVKFMQSKMVGWWNEISKSKSHLVSLLGHANQLDDNEFEFPHRIADATLTQICLETFLKVLPSIHDLVEETCQNIKPDIAEFLLNKDLIQQYLSYGIVPSRLIQGGVAREPSGLALVNASHLFYLEMLDVLIDKIEGADAKDLENRSFWTMRVEAWIAKALEDIG